MPLYAGAGNTRSNSMRGRISPKVMAKMIRNAVTPFVAMLVSRNRQAESAPKPLGSCNRPFCGLPVNKQKCGRQRGRL
jgi:hypothetical protein